MSRVYLAGRYSRREELAGYAAELERYGHLVTSRWLAGNHQVDDAGLSLEAGRADRERFAGEDFEDVLAADTLIAFTESPRSSNSRGGRHVEMGLALGMGRRVIVCGPAENVFCCLPIVQRVDTFADCLPLLDAGDDPAMVAPSRGDFIWQWGAYDYLGGIADGLLADGKRLRQMYGAETDLAIDWLLAGLARLRDELCRQIVARPTEEESRGLPARDWAAINAAYQRYANPARPGEDGR